MANNEKITITREELSAAISTHLGARCRYHSVRNMVAGYGYHISRGEIFPNEIFDNLKNNQVTKAINSLLPKELIEKIKDEKNLEFKAPFEVKQANIKEGVRAWVIINKAKKFVLGDKSEHFFWELSIAREYCAAMNAVAGA